MSHQLRPLKPQRCCRKVLEFIVGTTADDARRLARLAPINKSIQKLVNNLLWTNLHVLEGLKLLEALAINSRVSSKSALLKCIMSRGLNNNSWPDKRVWRKTKSWANLESRIKPYRYVSSWDEAMETSDQQNQSWARFDNVAAQKHNAYKNHTCEQAMPTDDRIRLAPPTLSL